METEENKNRKLKKEYPEAELQELNKVSEPALGYEVQRYSYADYLTWADDKMREIINGMVYALSAPLRKHAKATSVFMVRIGNFISRRKGKCEIYHAPFDVRLPKNGETADNKIYDVVQPDICVVCDPAKLDERGCIGAPDLIVEVLSPSTGKRDLNEKYNLYESSGVREYWVVYPEDRAVTVFLLQEETGKYDEGTTYQVINNETKVPVYVLEGLIIDLEELFKD